MAYKRELIVNNGSLTSYKKLLKVSDVCQLLDKSKYPETDIYDGVTYTNNGDGTITLNGTATAITNYNLQSGIQVIAGHKYLPFFYNNNISEVYLLLYAGNDTGVFDNRFPGAGGSIVTCLKTYNAVYYQIKVTTGKTLSNLTTKPQLFDLTEMYGAGNEPKTVAEFKAKFPNELYDYSPRCWVKSYKTGLIAQTKNLLSEIKPWTNAKVENGIVYQIVADTREFDTLKVQIYNGGTFVKNWGGENQQMGKNTLTFTTDVLPTHTRVVFGLNGLTYDMTVGAPITLENNTTYTLSMDFINITQGEIAWTNSMLEKGTTATDYVPYGYL